MNKKEKKTNKIDGELSKEKKSCMVWQGPYYPLIFGVWSTTVFFFFSVAFLRLFSWNDNKDNYKL